MLHVTILRHLYSGSGQGIVDSSLCGSYILCDHVTILRHLYRELSANLALARVLWTVLYVEAIFHVIM